jgi:hypothetical protein
MLSFSRHPLPTPQFQFHALLIHPAGEILFAHAHGLEYVSGSAQGEFLVSGVIQFARVVLGVSSRSRSARRRVARRVARRVQARPWNSTIFSRSASPTLGSSPFSATRFASACSERISPLRMPFPFVHDLLLLMFTL